jgi:hypothetical protein
VALCKVVLPTWGVASQARCSGGILYLPCISNRSWLSQLLFVTSLFNALQMAAGFSYAHTNVYGLAYSFNVFNVFCLGTNTG